MSDSRGEQKITELESEVETASQANLGVYATWGMKFHKAGLPVIPMMPDEKRPIAQKWQEYGLRGPTEREVQSWIAQYPYSGLCLILGPASGLMAVDVDTDDVGIHKVVESLLPKGLPWIRIGRKGYARLVAWDPDLVTHRIDDESGVRVVDILSKGTQIVIPPTIHPDTGRPYFESVPLLDVVDELRAAKVPSNFADRLRSGLTTAGYKLRVGGSASFIAVAPVPVGGRDTTVTSHAGIIARDIIRGVRTLAQGIDEMRTWVDTYVEKTLGDEITPDMGVEKLLRFLKNDTKAAPLLDGWAEGLSSLELETYKKVFGVPPEETLQERINIHLGEGPKGLKEALMLLSQHTRNDVLLRDAHISLTKTKLRDFGISLSVSVIRQQVKGFDPVPEQDEDSLGIIGDSHTEIVEHMQENLPEGMALLRSSGAAFWNWTGTHWQKVDNKVILTEVSDRYGKLCPAARRYGDHKGIVSMLNNSLDKGDFEPLMAGLNFLNGFATINGNLIPHDPDLMMRYVLPYNSIPFTESSMPKFSRFLRDCWGECPDYTERVSALQEAIGLTLTQESWRFEKVWMLHGITGSNGKSTLMAIIRGLVDAEQVSSVPPKMWSDKKDRFAMVGSSVNLCGELSEKGVLEGDWFKSIVSGENVHVEQKYVDSKSVAIRASHWFCSNHIPRTADVSKAFWRRWNIWTFPRMIPEELVTIRLDEIILREEREAIAAWALEGYKRVRSTGRLTSFSSCLDMIEEAKESNDSVLWFYRNRMVGVVGGQLNLSECYYKYRLCTEMESGGKPVALLKFRDRLRSFGVNVGDSLIEGVKYR